MTALRRMLSSGLASSGLVVIVLLAVVALGAPLLAPYDHTAIDAAHIPEEPSAVHWLGTDGLGRDVLSRMIYGAQISLMVGFVSFIPKTYHWTLVDCAKDSRNLVLALTT